MYFQPNLTQLASTQIASYQTLSAIYESAFSLSPEGIQFLSLTFSVPEEPLRQLEYVPNILILYGMGNGQWVRELLKQVGSLTQVWILDAQPELAWLYLHDFDLQDILADQRVSWWVETSEALIAQMAQSLKQAMDHYGLLYLENPLAASIAERLQNPLLQYLRQENSQRQELPSVDALSHNIAQLYQSLEQPMQQAYQSYPLTCKQGCADCCKTSVSYHLCVNPLEWLHMHTQLWQLPAPLRQTIYHRSVQSLAQHSDYLAEVLHFFDQHNDRFRDPTFHLELLEMAREKRKQACVFLGQDDQCQVYQGRPLTCRIFGNSYGLMQVPFTCDKDDQRMEQILLDEGQNTHLVEASVYRDQMTELHQSLTHKQVMNAWVFTHLDFDTADFKPVARVDYQQFQELVRHPELLQARLKRLKQAEQLNV